MADILTKEEIKTIEAVNKKIMIGLYSTDVTALMLIIHRLCSEKILTDLDLPPANRTQANLWMAECLRCQRELRNANKGLMRLNKKIKRLKKADGYWFPCKPVRKSDD